MNYEDDCYYLAVVTSFGSKLYAVFLPPAQLIFNQNLPIMVIYDLYWHQIMRVWLYFTGTIIMFSMHSTHCRVLCVPCLSHVTIDQHSFEEAVYEFTNRNYI